MESAGPSAIIDALDWIEHALLGSAATTLATMIAKWLRIRLMVALALPFPERASDA